MNHAQHGLGQSALAADLPHGLRHADHAIAEPTIEAAASGAENRPAGRRFARERAAPARPRPPRRSRANRCSAARRGELAAGPGASARSPRDCVRRRRMRRPRTLPPSFARRKPRRAGEHDASTSAPPQPNGQQPRLLFSAVPTALRGDQGNGQVGCRHGVSTNESLQMSPLSLWERGRGCSGSSRLTALTLTLSQRERGLAFSRGKASLSVHATVPARCAGFVWHAPERKARRRLGAGRRERRFEPGLFQPGRQGGASLVGQFLRRLQQHDGSAALVDHRRIESLSASQRNGR